MIVPVWQMGTLRLQEARYAAHGLTSRRQYRVGSSPGCLSPTPTLGPRSSLSFLLTPPSPISHLPLSCFFLLFLLPEQALKWSPVLGTQRGGAAEVCLPSQPCSVWSCPRGNAPCIIVYNGQTPGCPSTRDQINNSRLLHNGNLCSHYKDQSSPLENNI